MLKFTMVKQKYVSRIDAVCESAVMEVDWQGCISWQVSSSLVIINSSHFGIVLSLLAHPVKPVCTIGFEK